MATLSSIILAKNPDYEGEEANLETGKIFYYSPNVTTNHCGVFKYVPPGVGCVRVEIWGAGGSGAKMCCCGGSLPGNPGAYVVKCFAVDAASRVCGCIGISCGNADVMCYRGRSTSTCVCWFGAASESSSCGCLCAQGGEGGTSYCTSSSSNYCCFVADSVFCTTLGVLPNGSGWGSGCGSYCNTRTDGTVDGTKALAYGGDVNCHGGISCASSYTCDSPNHCYHQNHIRTPAGVHSTCGAYVTFSGDNDSAASIGGTAQYQQSHLYALDATKRSPTQGNDLAMCYFGRMCGCYEANGCQPTLPHGHGGAGSQVCNSVRDQGQRGGMGAIRIRWKA